MPDTVAAYVGLGSNLNDPAGQLHAAFAELDRIEGTRVIARSAIYRSPPMGPSDQPHYLNAVVELETALAPEPLLDELQRIERAHGRVRERHWGPRTLDLDILLYGDRTIASDRLKVPHPGLATRAFVLVPLREIAPELSVPGLGPVAALACPDAGLERLDDATLSGHAATGGRHER